jgi:glycosyltransferase involved in cell wall biosynthesis
MFDLTIPVLNEEETLERNVLKSLNYIQTNITKNIRIIIADNGSTDKTQYIGEKLDEKYNEITFLKVPRKGVGLALRTSWMSSKADVVGYMDLDLATDLKHLKEVYDILIKESEFEIVNGSRLLKKSKVENRTILREVTSRVFNKLVQNLLGVKLSDGMCGFKFFKRERAVELINTGINIDGWFFSTEILVKAYWVNSKVKEIPVKWTDDINSKVNVKKLSKEYFIEILRLRKEKSSFILKNKF